VAGTADDKVTPIQLTRQVAARAPQRTAYFEARRAHHLGLFSDPDYRAAVLATLAPPAVEALVMERGRSFPVR
jgi:hypothetical protein